VFQGSACYRGITIQQKYQNKRPDPNSPYTQKLAASILEQRPHPEQGYRSCLGLLRLGKTYSPERLEAACSRALDIKAYSYKNVESILKKGLDQQPSPLSSSQRRLPLLIHENLRGKQYYQ
jgi:transposase